MRHHPRNPYALQLQDKKTDSRVVIGAYIPVTLYEDISANALTLGIARSEMIEKATSHYIKNYGKSPADIILILAQRAMAEWESFRQASIGKIGWNEKEEFQTYKKGLIKALKKRGIAENLISKIMERIK